MIKAWLPNAITIARLPLAGITIACILDQRFAAAFWLLILAGLSDALDGLIARWLNARTQLGSYLDPIADKVLLVGVFLALGAIGLLPTWLVTLVVVRDVVILAGSAVLYAAERTIQSVKPTVISKINTALQTVLAVITLWVYGFGLRPDLIIPILIVGVAMTTIASGLGYAVRLMRRLRVLKRQSDKGGAQES